MRQSQLILSNAGIIWVTQFLQLFPQLILVPYLIANIGETGYGVYALVWSLLMSIQQLQLALQSGVVKYSAGLLAQGQLEDVNEVASSSLVYSIVLAVVASFVTLSLTIAYADPDGPLRQALLVVGAIMLFVFPLTPHIAVIQAKQRFYIGAIADTFSKYAGLAAIVAWFSLFGPSIGIVIVILAVLLFVFTLAQVPFAYKLVPTLVIRPAFFDRRRFREIALFGGATVLIAACLAINSTGLRWLMGHLVSTSFVTHMVIMLMPSLLLTQVIRAVTVTVMPATSHYEARGDGPMLQALLMRGMRYITLLLLATLIVGAVLMEHVIELWVGQEYVFLAPYAIALFASTSIMLTTSVCHHMLKGLGKVKTVVGVYVAALVVVPVISIFFLYQQPYLAVTVGLAVGHILCAAMQVWFASKAVGARLGEQLRCAYLGPISGFFLVALISFGILSGFDVTGPLQTSGLAGVAVVVYLGLMYWLVATPAERAQVRSFF